MTTLSFKNQTITALRAATVVERGDDMQDWSNPDEHDIEGCRLQPMATEEIHFSGSAASEGGTGRDAVVTRWKVYGPYDADLTSLDRVRHDGVVYSVEGQVQRWRSPTGRLAHFECEIKRVEG